MPTDSVSTSSVSTPLESQRTRHARARVGTLLSGKWQLDELLGVGGMAAVYAATHRNGRRAALKILHPALSEVAEVRERFFDEAYAANRVAHQGTVAVLDDGTCPDGALYLVMDLLEGENLEARLTRADRGLPAAEVIAMMAPLLEVLATAHDRGILHRDIKPENVFLTTEGEIKLLDFGIARVSDSRRTSRTRAGLTLGTPSFMPPEQARGRWTELDARSDVWAAGATMFTLLTARFVHSGETQNEALLAAMSHRAPELRSVAPHVPVCVAAIVDRALAFAREDRFADARAMLHAVLEAQRTLMDLEGRPAPRPCAGEVIAPLRFAPLEAGVHQNITLVDGTAGTGSDTAHGTASDTAEEGPVHETVTASVVPRRGNSAVRALALLGAMLFGTGYVSSIAPGTSPHLDRIDLFGFLGDDEPGSPTKKLDAAPTTSARKERSSVGSGPAPRNPSDLIDSLVCFSPTSWSVASTQPSPGIGRAAAIGEPVGPSTGSAISTAGNTTGSTADSSAAGNTTERRSGRPRRAPPQPSRDPLARRK